MDSGLSIVWQALPGILGRLPATITYVLAPTLVAAILGPLFAAARLSRFRILRWVVTVMVSFLRGTPALVQIYIVFYGLPLVAQQWGLDINGWSAGVFFIIATALNFSAFVSESLRGSFLAMDHGQIEAGKSIGFSGLQVFVRVIVPQTLRTAALNLKNLEIDLVKGTSLAYTIGAIEIMGYADQIAATRSGVGRMWLLAAVSVIYFVITAAVEYGFNRWFAYLSRHEEVRGHA